jgi:hypothetical protein
VAVAVERDFPGAESTAFIDIIRDADAPTLAQITEALAALATCDVTTNKQWREFSGRDPGPAQLALDAADPPAPLRPRLWIKWRGGRC